MLISVDKVADAVFWIKQLTYDISQKPYLCAFACPFSTLRSFR